jgi:hypothetical protein
MKSVATARGDVNAQPSLAMGVPRKFLLLEQFSNGVNAYARGRNAGSASFLLHSRSSAFVHHALLP